MAKTVKMLASEHWLYDSNWPGGEVPELDLRPEMIKNSTPRHGGRLWAAQLLAPVRRPSRSSKLATGLCLARPTWP